VLILILLAGFTAAPFAGLGARRLRERVATSVLLGSTIAATALAAFGFDCGLMRPSSWILCAVAVVAGVGLCGYVFILRRLRFALVCGAALFVITLALHLFGLGASGVCQRACSGLRKGMSADKVKASVLMRLHEEEHYRVIARDGFLPSAGIGVIGFELRPNYVNLPVERITVWFADQRFTSAFSTAVHFPHYFLPPIRWATIVLWLVCLWRMGKTNLAPQVIAENIVSQLREVRAQGCAQYVAQKGASGGMYRSALVHFARKRLWCLEYFAGRDKGRYQDLSRRSGEAQQFPEKTGETSAEQGGGNKEG